MQPTDQRERHVVHGQLLRRGHRTLFCYPSALSLTGVPGPLRPLRLAVVSIPRWTMNAGWTLTNACVLIGSCALTCDSTLLEDWMASTGGTMDVVVAEVGPLAMAWCASCWKVSTLSTKEVWHRQLTGTGGERCCGGWRLGARRRGDDIRRR